MKCFRNGINIGFALAAALLLAGGCSADEPNEQMGRDGRIRAEDSRVARVYIEPGPESDADADADFSLFKRAATLDPFVAFHSSRQWHQNRSRSGNIGSADMERIQADVDSMCRAVFDSIASDIPGLAALRQAIRNGGGMVYCNNRVTFTAQARRKVGPWSHKSERFSAPLPEQIAVSLPPVRLGRN